MTRALRAAFPSIALLAWVVFVAALAHGDVKKHDDAVDWWPGRGRIGPERCGNADTRQGGNSDGTWAYFKDAEATCPMVCTGTPTSDGTGPGAYCVHEAGQWDCCHGSSQICTGCDPNPCQNGGVCVPNCNGAPICICPCGFTGDQCETPASTTTTTTSTPTTTTIPMPECEIAGAPCGSCGDGICLSRCDGITCAFICVSIVGSPCESLACQIAGPTAVCVDQNPTGCVDGVCDGDRACGQPCFGSTSTTTTTTGAPTTTTTVVTTTTTTDTTPTTTTTIVTTTTTTVTTSTTTTTTSTTTTTTIVDSVTILWAPTVPAGSQEQGIGTNDLLSCSAWTPTLGIAHATSIVLQTSDSGGGGSDFFSLSIYNAAGSTRITTTGAVLDTINGVYAVNTGDFSLDAGTKYQVCTCGNGTGTHIRFFSGNPGTGDAVSAIANSIAGGELRTTAANACTTGAPPSTTGTLTAVQHNRMPIFLMGTNTP